MPAVTMPPRPVYGATTAGPFLAPSPEPLGAAPVREHAAVRSAMAG